MGLTYWSHRPYSTNRPQYFWVLGLAWDASIRPLNLGTWAVWGASSATDRSVTECVGCYDPFRRGHLLMTRENVKGW